MAKEAKTNALRILDRHNVSYRAHAYPHDNRAVDGVTAAALTGRPPEQVFKTLVTRGHGKGYYVFVIPAAAELDLKAAARSVGEKSVELIPVKELLPVTGYVRGGCSPVGMKRSYPTVIDSSCLVWDTILCSGGRIGLQIELAPGALIAVTEAQTAVLTRTEESGRAGLGQEKKERVDRHGKNDSR